MSIQYVDTFGDAVNHTTETFNIGATNDQFQIVIDGGSTQTFTLTHGATRTAANIVADINGGNGNTAITSGTCSVVTIGGGVNYIRIRTTSNSGAGSTILVNAPSNNANSTLGFLATTYTGGTNYNNTFVSGSSGTDKQSVITAVETALNSAGWVTISGHASTPCILQSAMTPPGQNLRMRIQMTTNSTNSCTLFEIMNVGQSKGDAPGTTASTTNGCFLLPGTSKTFRVVANRYQAFIFCPGANNPREYVGFGVLQLPSFMQGLIYEAIWMNGNASSDSDTTARGSFRSAVGGWNGSNGGNAQFILNESFWEVANAPTTGGAGTLSIVGPGGGIAPALTSWYRWHDSSAFIFDPLMSWGRTSNTDEAHVYGQLWDCMCTTEAYTIDTTLTSIDSHNWWCLTNNNTGSGQCVRGSVFVVAP